MSPTQPYPYRDWSPHARQQMMRWGLWVTMVSVVLMGMPLWQHRPPQMAFVAVDDQGRTWIDGGDRLWVLDAAGNTQMELLPGNSGVPTPYGGMVAMSNGCIAVGSIRTGDVYILDAHGQVQQRLDLGLRGTPQLAYDPNSKTLYAAENTPGRVSAWRGGHQIAQTTGLHGPFGLVVAPDGKLWVAENDDDAQRFAVFDGSLRRLATVSSGNSEFPRPKMLAIDTDNNRYASLASSDLSAGRVAVYGHGRTPLLLALPGQALPVGIAITKGGRLLVVDSAQSRLYSIQGTRIQEWGDARLQNHLASYHQRRFWSQSWILMSLLMAITLLSAIPMLRRFQRERPVILPQTRATVVVKRRHPSRSWTGTYACIGMLLGGFGLLILRELQNAKCHPGEVCLYRALSGAPNLIFAFNLLFQTSHRQRQQLFTPCANDTAWELAFNGGPQLAELITAQGGLIDGVAEGYGSHIPLRPAGYFLATEKGVLAIQLDRKTFEVATLEDIPYADIVSFSAVATPFKDHTSWQLQTRTGSSATLNLAGMEGSRMADTIRHFQYPGRSMELDWRARWLPGYWPRPPGKLRWLQFVPALMLLPWVFIAYETRFSLWPMVLVSLPPLGLVVDQYRESGTYLRKTYRPLSR